MSQAIFLRKQIKSCFLLTFVSREIFEAVAVAVEQEGCFFLMQDYICTLLASMLLNFSFSHDIRDQYIFLYFRLFSRTMHTFSFATNADGWIQTGTTGVGSDRSDNSATTIES